MRKDLRPLYKLYKKDTQAFWLDYILLANLQSVHGKIGFSAASINNGAKTLIDASEGKIYYNDMQTSDFIFTLLTDGYIEKISDGVYRVTPSGVSFYNTKGGYRTAFRRLRYQDRLLQFNTFKIGWDTVISLIALGISIWALINSKG